MGGSKRKGTRKSVPSRAELVKAHQQMVQNERIHKSAMADLDQYKELIRSEYNGFLVHVETSNRGVRMEMLKIAASVAIKQAVDKTPEQIIAVAEKFADWVKADREIILSQPDYLYEEEVKEANIADHKEQEPMSPISEGLKMEVISPTTRQDLPPENEQQKRK